MLRNMPRRIVIHLKYIDIPRQRLYQPQLFLDILCRREVLLPASVNGWKEEREWFCPKWRVNRGEMGKIALVGCIACTLQKS